MDIKIVSTGLEEETPQPQPQEQISLATSKTAEPKTISFELEGEPGEAVFRVPLVGDMRRVEKEKIPEITDQFRRLAQFCLISWAGRDQMPPAEEIDAFDDQEMFRLMLRQATAVNDESVEDAELLSIFTSSEAGEENSFEVLPDRTHRVHLPPGAVTLRRLNQKDIKNVEKAAKSSGAVTTDVLTACSICVEWWGGNRRAIMPADFDSIPLAEFRRVSAALASFLKRSKRSK